MTRSQAQKRAATLRAARGKGNAGPNAEQPATRAAPTRANLSQKKAASRTLRRKAEVDRTLQAMGITEETFEDDAAAHAAAGGQPPAAESARPEPANQSVASRRIAARRATVKRAAEAKAAQEKQKAAANSKVGRASRAATLRAARSRAAAGEATATATQAARPAATQAARPAATQTARPAARSATARRTLRARAAAETQSTAAKPAHANKSVASRRAATMRSRASARKDAAAGSKGDHLAPLAPATSTPVVTDSARPEDNVAAIDDSEIEAMLMEGGHVEQQEQGQVADDQAQEDLVDLSEPAAKEQGSVLGLPALDDVEF